MEFHCRDRHRWAGLSDRGSVAARVRAQAQVAIDEADVILFLVDSREGVTANDLEIAETLRRTSKPVLLVANKVEDYTDTSHLADLYQLGLGEAIPISAVHGQNVGDLLDEVISLRRSDAVQHYDESAVRMAVVGRPNAGKSSLVNAMLGENRSIVDSEPGTTRDAIDTLFWREGKPYIIIDTAGLRRKGRVREGVERYSAIRTLRAVDECDLGLLLIDATVGVQPRIHTSQAT